jgi:hypothetical protein
MDWKKIWDGIGDGAGEAGKPPAPKYPWIPADKNPWKIPVLDVRPLTTSMLSTSQDPTCASNASSYGHEDGLCFVGQKPPLDRSLPVALQFRRDRLLADGVLFQPQAMEHKWAVFVHSGRLLFIRSWLRQVLAVADIVQEGDRINVVRLTGSFQGDKAEDPGLAVRTLEYLIWSHGVGLQWPAPLPAGLEKDPHHAAMYCFSAFGKMAHFAAALQPAGPASPIPLRSHSLLHIAVARTDPAAVDAQLRAGIPIDLLAGDGLPPMHWALATEGLSMLEFLLSKGSPVDVRSAEGATTLMGAAQGAKPEQLEWLLAHGADVNARDPRGFTALHRAAEMGLEPLVELLLRRGADARVEAQGHTARSLAEKRGQKDIVRRLEAAGA